MDKSDRVVERFSEGDPDDLRGYEPTSEDRSGKDGVADSTGDEAELGTVHRFSF